MGNVKIEINSNAVAALLKSPEVQAELERRARRIAERAGDGFEVHTKVGPNRAKAEVRAATAAAKIAESRDRALTRAIDAGR